MTNARSDAGSETGVRLVRATERTQAAAQTPGMIREAAIETDALWAGIARTAPRNQSGWHHHGDWETVVYVIQGAVRVECGAGGRTIVVAEQGAHLFVPRHEVHRESNPTDDEQVLAVVRVGHGPVVINVDAP